MASYREIEAYEIAEQVLGMNSADARRFAAGSNRTVTISEWKDVGAPLNARILPDTPPGRCKWCLWPLSGRQTSYCSNGCGNAQYAWRNGRNRFSLAILCRDAYTCRACGIRPVIKTQRWIVDQERLEAEIDRRVKHGYTRAVARTNALLNARDLFTVATGDLASSRDLPDLPALHVDHIVPFSKGGKTTWTNCQTLCAKCNLRKGNRDGAQLDL